MTTIVLNHPLYESGIKVDLPHTPILVSSFHQVLKGYLKQLPKNDGYLNITHPKVSEKWSETIIRIKPPWSISKKHMRLFIGTLVVKWDG